LTSEDLQQKSISFINQLQRMYPITFPEKPEPKVPLAIGIFQALCERKEAFGVDLPTIKEALNLWCMGTRYLLALSTPGSSRYTLDGIPFGEVSNKDASRASKELRILKKLRSQTNPS